jgi:hypothetical protein
MSSDLSSDSGGTSHLPATHWLAKVDKGPREGEIFSWGGQLPFSRLKEQNWKIKKTTTSQQVHITNYN